MARRRGGIGLGGKRGRKGKGEGKGGVAMEQVACCNTGVWIGPVQGKSGA